MKLDKDQLQLVRNYLHWDEDEDERLGEFLPNIELQIGGLDKLGVLLNSPFYYLYLTESPVFITVPSEEKANRRTLDLFRLRVITHLLVRIDASWQCFINCGNKILEETCEEDKESTKKCCIGLKQQCKDGF